METPIKTNQREFQGKFRHGGNKRPSRISTKVQEKISAINKINAAFMEYAQEKAPELVASFFKTQEATISETYYPFC